jgi:hypothetical protein
MFALVQTGDLERIEELVEDFPEPLPDNWARSMALHHAALTGQDLDPIMTPELLLPVVGPGGKRLTLGADEHVRTPINGCRLANPFPKRNRESGNQPLPNPCYPSRL